MYPQSTWNTLGYTENYYSQDTISLSCFLKAFSLEKGLCHIKRGQFKAGQRAERILTGLLALCLFLNINLGLSVIKRKEKHYLPFIKICICALHLPYSLVRYAESYGLYLFKVELVSVHQLYFISIVVISMNFTISVLEEIKQQFKTQISLWWSVF